MKVRCTLLLTANADSNFKLKLLMVYHAENTHALKVCAKGRLAVNWRANQKKKRVTGLLFEEYFPVLHLELKAYCVRQVNLSRF